MKTKMPVLFVSHGNPMTVFDQSSASEYFAWTRHLPNPKALVIFSAHWETERLNFGEIVRHNELVYDFYGFSDELYQLQYPAEAAAYLVQPIRDLLKNEIAVTTRGLDHGVWVPLLHMWPDANIPILQMSIPSGLSNQGLMDIGKKLSPLRDEGVMIVGAGTLTHNIPLGLSRKYSSTPEWAIEFDQWVEDALLHNRASILEWEIRAPQAKLNHPTAEHFKPLLIAMGAASDKDEVSFPITGFDFQVFSKRSVQFG